MDYRLAWIAAVCLAPAASAVAQGGRTVQIDVFDAVTIQWNPDLPEVTDRDDYVVRFSGQAVERRLDLPLAPALPRDEPRILATVTVEPVTSGDPAIPNDPWTRLGAITLIIGADTRAPEEVELVRFITPYGGPATYEVDLTSLAPYLHGTRTIRGFISTFSDEPGWRLSLRLTYSQSRRGARRPILAEQIMRDEHVTAEDNILRADVTIPPGVVNPRIRVITTGHSTDGRDGNEFISCRHVLRVDEQVVAAWRPWVEGDGRLRQINPWAGRSVVDGVRLWACDFDRSGWQPGLVVEPTFIPAPELTAGRRHRVTLAIEGIRPRDAEGEHGYWAVSAIVVADDPWPLPAEDRDEDEGEERGQAPPR